jgi:cell wall assembly regulator SMI1
MKRLFDRLHAWLSANAPEVLASLRPGATEEAIRAAEAFTCVALPDSVRAAYRIHDGQEYGQDLLYGRRWLPLADVVGSWRAMKARVDDGSFPLADHVPPDEATRADYWHPAWIPLASNDAGGLLCLDLDPAPSGTAGQILYWWHDMGSPRSLAASSFADWLEELVDELEEGGWTTHPDYDGLVRVDEVPEDDEE